MGCLYLPFFDVSELSLGTITITRTTYSGVPYTLNALTSDDSDSDPSSIFQLHTFTQIVSNDTVNVMFRDFATAGYYAALTTALRALLVVEWGSHQNFNILMSTTTGKVTISADVNFGITWTTTAGRAMFGFSGNVTQTASSYAGTYTPNYMIDSTLAEPSRMSAMYEPDGLGSHAIADNGQGSMMTRYEAPLYADWHQEYESKFKTYRVGVGHGTSIGLDPSHPFSFQELYEHCRRQGMPFIRYSDSEVTKVFIFRTEQMHFKPERAGDGNDAQFHIPFRCIDCGFAV